MAVTTEPAEQTTPATGTPTGHLDRSLVQGVAWTAGIKWSVQIVVWVATLAVIRLLSPDDYGIMGMATLYIGLIQLLSEFGVRTAVINMPGLSRSEISQLHTLAVAFGVAGFVLAGIAAVPLGWFFAAPRLPAVIVGMGVGFAVTGLGVVPSAVLMRDMHFRRVALYGGMQSLSASAATVVLALAGFRYWSLVIGNLIGITVFVTLVQRDRPQRFERPRRASIGEALNLSTNVIVSRVSWYVYSNSDFLTVGRVLGQAALGVYSVAWTLATLAVDKITAIVGQVTPSIFSAAQSDLPSVKRYLLRITEALALVTFPVCLGMALVADPATQVLLGPKWVDVVIPLQALAVFGILRSITSFLSQILNAIGDSAFPMRVGVLSAIVFPAAFYFGSRWGIRGISLTWIVCYPVLVVPLYVRVMHRIDLTLREYLTALWPAISGSLVMGLVVATAELLMADRVAPALQLVVSIPSGAAAYVVTMLALHRSRFDSFRAVVSGAFAKEVGAKRSAPASAGAA